MAHHRILIFSLLLVELITANGPLVELLVVF